MNKRIILIAELLLQKNEYITVNTISESLNVSNKTIRNDLFVLEEWIKEFGLTLDKKTGVGIAIRGNEELKLNILSSLNTKSNIVESYSPEDRRNLILNRLFISKSKVRIHELAKELHVSRATIHKDLITVEEWLNNYNITLLRRTNHGLEIKYKEKNIRKAISSLISLNKLYLGLKEILQIGNPEESIPHSSFSKTIENIINIDFLKLQSIFLYWDKLDSYRFTDEAIISLLIHIGISICRIKEDNPMILSKDLLNNLKNMKDFQSTYMLCKSISDEFNVVFTDDEIGYILLHILGSKTYNNSINDNYFSETDLSSLVAKELINYWKSVLNINFTEDHELLSALTIHLKPALHRIDFSMPICNPILADIKNTYPNTFKVVEESSFIIKKYVHGIVNEDEIGYLTLHLASAIDRTKRPLRTIVVCNGGVGATQLLTNKLKNEFNQLDIISSISCTSLFNRGFKDIDLIISTTSLDFTTDNKVISINPILRKQDIFRLNSLIKKLYSEKNSISIQLIEGDISTFNL